MRLIDADKILEKMQSVFDMQDLYLPVHFQQLVVDDMPTVDAVPVVRCRECKYCEYDALFSNWWCKRIRDDIGFEKLPNWYCADGEREDDETD